MSLYLRHRHRHPDGTEEIIPFTHSVFLPSKPPQSLPEGKRIPAQSAQVLVFGVPEPRNTYKAEFSTEPVRCNIYYSGRLYILNSEGKAFAVYDLDQANKAPTEEDSPESPKPRKSWTVSSVNLRKNKPTRFNTHPKGLQSNSALL